MRMILTTIFLTITIQVFADHGTAYFFKCKVTTTSTTITGYFCGPYEFLYDTTLLKFKADNKYFQRRILRDLNNVRDKAEIGVADFVYVHEFFGRKSSIRI
jgi:hypothetical protein